MENYFTNLSAIVWVNLDRPNPIKSYDLFPSVGQFPIYRPLMWHCANICDVTTVQLSNGTVHKFHKIFAFHEQYMYLPST